MLFGREAHEPPGADDGTHAGDRGMVDAIAECQANCCCGKKIAASDLHGVSGFNGRHFKDPPIRQGNTLRFNQTSNLQRFLHPTSCPTSPSGVELTWTCVLQMSAFGTKRTFQPPPRFYWHNADIDEGDPRGGMRKKVGPPCHGSVAQA
jgi:hypothetical protein